MSRKLRVITDAITQHLQSRFAQGGTFSTHKLPAGLNNHTLADPLYIAFLQGEALLRLAFFSYLNERSIHDASSLALLWRQLIEDKRSIQQVVEQSGLSHYFNFGSEPSAQQHYPEQCFTAYCILLFDADAHNNQRLVHALTKGLIIHFMPSLYPEQAKTTDTKLLKREIAKRLALKWHIRPEIKESFNVSDSAVRFSLLCKLPDSPPFVLITLEGKRLKPTRFQCYQKALDQLESGALNPSMPAVAVIKKKRAPVPIG